MAVRRLGRRALERPRRHAPLGPASHVAAAGGHGPRDVPLRGAPGGRLGGVFSLCWFATTPAFLAFGPLVLTDTAVALFSLAALWTFASMWREQSRRATRIFALAAGPGAAIEILVRAAAIRLRGVPFRAARNAAGRPTLRRRVPRLVAPGWRQTFKGVLMAALLVYGVELALSWNQPTDLLKIIGGGWAALALRRMLLPAVTYLGGVVLCGFGLVRPTYLLGQSYAHGIWYFFPVMTLLKSTLAFLAAVTLSLAAALAGRFGRVRTTAVRAGMEFHWRALWLEWPLSRWPVWQAR